MQYALEEEMEEGSASSSEKKAITQRLAEISAELSAIQKALVAILGVGAINALTADKYNDEIPPVITINGQNPATVELGDTYSDAGATAMDAYHGTTAVSIWKCRYNHCWHIYSYIHCYRFRQQHCNSNKNC